MRFTYIVITLIAYQVLRTDYNHTTTRVLHNSHYAGVNGKPKQQQTGAIFNHYLIRINMYR